MQVQCRDNTYNFQSHCYLTTKGVLLLIRDILIFQDKRAFVNPNGKKSICFKEKCTKRRVQTLLHLENNVEGLFVNVLFESICAFKFNVMFFNDLKCNSRQVKNFHNNIKDCFSFKFKTKNVTDAII